MIAQCSSARQSDCITALKTDPAALNGSEEDGIAVFKRVPDQLRAYLATSLKKKKPPSFDWRGATSTDEFSEARERKPMF
jgi:hypothetical protein